MAELRVASNVEVFPSVVNKTRLPNNIESNYSGTHLLKQFRQTIATPVPCVVFYDPKTENIRVVAVDGLEADWLLIEVLV